MSDTVLIFDTTLRDGEQSPGCSMTLDEKLRMGLLLDDMGVDIIEAGFPAASKGDFDSVNQLAAQIKSATIAGLCRALEKDIDAVVAAIKPAEKRRVHTFISTSPLHMKYKLKMEPEQVLEAVTRSVTYARKFCDDVEWSAEDGTRTDHDFLCQTVEAAIAAGATTVNIPDTVGYTLPQEYFDLITMLKNRVPNIDQAVISTHCHNDLGLGVANSLAAVRAGARQVECTINGIGERAGNAALEEIVMAMRVRKDYMPFETNIKSEMITRASRLLSTITGFNVQPNKAIVGANAFAHESGIHQDGMLKHAGTYEIMTPESVGRTQTKLVLGKHSGRNAFKSRLAELNYVLSEDEINDAFSRFKDLADKKKDVFDEDLIALVDDEVVRDTARIRFGTLQVIAGSKGPQQATLELEIDGKTQIVETTGNGPVDAIFNAITSLCPHDATLELFQVHAVTAGTDAQAEVTVRLAEGGKSVTGQGADADTLVAAARAYIHALNKLLVKREKTAPAGI